jgi:hypothetical protein
MIFNTIKNLFKKEDKLIIEYSKYFPNKFYTNKLVIIDDSLKLFLSKSKIKLPTDPLIVKKITQFEIGNDEFEEIEFVDSQYKLLYDRYSGYFYVLELVHIGDDIGLINETDVVTNDGIGYKSWTGVQEMTNKKDSKLVAIFDRYISSEADEYFFIEVDKQFTERRYVGIICQHNLIN